MTFVEYVQRVRIRKAERLLKKRMIQGKIALDVGFGSRELFHHRVWEAVSYHTAEIQKRSGYLKTGQYT